MDEHFSRKRIREGAVKMPEAAHSSQTWQERNLITTGRTWPCSTNAEVSYFSNEHNEEHVSFDRLESFGDLHKRLYDMRMGDVRIVGIDLMGKGSTCADLACDETFALTLPTPKYESSEKMDQEEAVERGINPQYGDIFDKEQMQNLIQDLDDSLANRGKLGVVFFRPWGGMERYENNQYSHLYLYERVLKPLYDRLNVNGVMLMELFHLPDDEFDFLVNHLKVNGIWVSAIHQPRTPTSELGTRLLKIEKPLIVEQEIPDLDK